MRRAPYRGRLARGCLFFAALLLLALPASGPRGAAFSPSTALNPQGSAMPLIPYLDYYLDDTLSLDIDEAAAPSRASLYQPLALGKLPRSEGITWLRFTLAPDSPPQKPGAYLLDMGPSVPGAPLLYQPARNELSGAMEWRESKPAHGDILLLPEQTQEPLVCYIRISGLPGPWFSPMLRSPQNAAGNLGNLAGSGAILTLGVVALLCLLRSLGEKGQWRIWTALYVGVALTQALLGMPVIQNSFSFASVAASMAPGLALMLLPHVGRHLMATPRKAKSIDLQLLFLSVPGALLALAPLWAGLEWLDRWLDLWPAGIALLIPTAIGAWLLELPGARRFLLGVSLPPVFAAVAYYGLEFGLPAGILASGPLWGVALSALIIVAARSPLASETPKRSPQRISSPAIPILTPEEPVINLEHPLDDPHLRIVPQDTLFSEPVPPTQQHVPPPADELSLSDEPFAASSPHEAREQAIRVPLDKILRESAALGDCALPPTARQYAENILTACRDMATILDNPDYQPEAETTAARVADEVFNLQRILRDAHDYAIAAAEHAGIALSWYMPPHLDQMYRGDPARLSETLKLLVESAVRGTSHGSVHLSARRVPESADPGHILFTIADNGTGLPPLNRSTLAIARAWETAGNGYFSMEASQQGVSVAFSARFRPADAEVDPPSTHVILACEDAAQASQLAKIMEAIPCRVNQASTMREVLVCQRLDPASLLVACGRFARPAAADMVREFCDLALKAGYARGYVLAITADDSQWSLLKPSGFTHAMLEPVDASAFAETIRNLARGDQPGALPDASAPAGDEPQAGEQDLLDLMDAFYAHTNELENLSAAGAPQEPQAAPPEDNQKPAAPAYEPPPARSTAESGAPFEGPEWLGSVAENGRDEALAARKAGADGNSGAPRPAAMAEPAAHVPYDPIEWVGEPVPIGGGKAAEAGFAPPAADSAQKNADATAGGNNTAPTVSTAPPSPPAGEDEEPAPPRYSKDPIINGLLERLDTSMQLALQGHEHGNCAKVAAATATISKQAESFGLRLLSRMALCVERAANANDMAALNDLLPELAMAVERNRIASTQKK